MQIQASIVTHVPAFCHEKPCLRRAIAAFAFACLLLAAPHSARSQQAITVTFADFKSGKPIRNFYLAVEAWSGNRYTVTKDTTIVREPYQKAHDGTVTVRLPKRRSEAATVVFEASTKADKEGKIIIHLPQTPPERIELFSGDLAKPFSDFSSAAVLESGAVVPYLDDQTKSNLQVSAKPGEVIVLNKRVTVWERMLQEIP